MCDEYEATTTRADLRTVLRVDRDVADLRPVAAHLLPDATGLVVRVAPDGQRELAAMRWGFPPPPTTGARPVTNVRHTGSAYWKAWLAPTQRCVVPVTAFCLWTDAAPKRRVWFASRNPSRLFCFAGIWRPWHGTRGTRAAPATGDHLLYALLTTTPNDVVKPVHAKAMPVLLTTAEEIDVWLRAPVAEALALQRPAGSDAIAIEERPATD